MSQFFFNNATLITRAATANNEKQFVMIGHLRPVVR